jgi:hypothetical protein
VGELVFSVRFGVAGIGLRDSIQHVGVDAGMIVTAESGREEHHGNVISIVSTAGLMPTAPCQLRKSYCKNRVE